MPGADELAMTARERHKPVEPTCERGRGDYVNKIQFQRPYCDLTSWRSSSSSVCRGSVAVSGLSWVGSRAACDAPERRKANSEVRLRRCPGTLAQSEHVARYEISCLCRPDPCRVPCLDLVPAWHDTVSSRPDSRLQPTKLNLHHQTIYYPFLDP